MTKRSIPLVKNRTYESSFVSFFGKVGAWIVLVFLLPFLFISSSAGDRIDAWTDSVDNQLVIFSMVILVLGVFGVRWLVKTVKG